MAAVVEAVAKLGGLPRRHVHRGQVRRVVLDGQGAELVEVGDAGQRPPAVERGGRRIGLEVVGDVVGGLHEPARIMRREGLGAADNAHGFQLLLPHHSAAAVLRSDVAIVALDGGEAHEALPGGADGVDGQAMPGETVLELEGLLGLPGVLALQMRGVADLDDVVVDVQVGELLGLPLNDDGVVARVLEGRPEETVGLGRGGAVGLSAPRDDAEAARAPHGQPGQRARGQDEPVVGMVPVNLGPDLLVQDLGAETDTAHVLAHVLGPRLGPDLPRGQIHAQELAGIAGHGGGSGRGLGRGARGGRGRAHWTITDWGS